MMTKTCNVLLTIDLTYFLFIINTHLLFAINKLRKQLNHRKKLRFFSKNNPRVLFIESLSHTPSHQCTYIGPGLFTEHARTIYNREASAICVNARNRY